MFLEPTDYGGLSGGIRSVAFSPNGQYVISGGLDEMIRIGDLSQMENPAGQVLRPLIGRDRPYENIKIEQIKRTEQPTGRQPDGARRCR